MNLICPRGEGFYNFQWQLCARPRARVALMR
jgi:hypothetical protein